jgi:nitrogen fixation-related uncharacterized protein
LKLHIGWSLRSEDFRDEKGNEDKAYRDDEENPDCCVAVKQHLLSL